MPRERVRFPDDLDERQEEVPRVEVALRGQVLRTFHPVVDEGSVLLEAQHEQPLLAHVLEDQAPVDVVQEVVSPLALLEVLSRHGCVKPDDSAVGQFARRRDMRQLTGSCALEPLDTNTHVDSSLAQKAWLALTKIYSTTN